MKKKLRVGFDMDGVLLYNPARIVRRPFVLFKHIFIPKREKKFFIPTDPITKFVLRFFHLSSIFPGHGLTDIEKIIKKYDIEAYVITARFDFLEEDAKKWYLRLNQKGVFKNLYVNTQNEQPHLFKLKKVSELKLDVFVEDNFDIVSYLSKKSDASILWIKNIFDAFVTYPYKYNDLTGVAKKIETIAKKS